MREKGFADGYSIAWETEAMNILIDILLDGWARFRA